MTTNVTVHVNGRYRATVVKVSADGAKSDPVIIDGNYEGTPNPGGAHVFHVAHPAIASFEITEEYLAEAPPADGASTAQPA